MTSISNFKVRPSTHYRICFWKNLQLKALYMNIQTCNILMIEDLISHVINQI